MIAALNRFTLRFAKTFAVLALIAAPVFLLGVGYMFKLMYEAAPWWVTGSVFASWLIVLLGLASHLDTLERKGSQKAPDRQGGPD